MNDPVELHPQGGNRLSIVLRMVTSRNRVPFTPLDNIPPGLVRSPDRKLGEEISQRAHR